MKPGIYKLRVEEDEEEGLCHYVEFLTDRYEVTGKHYGNVLRNIKIIKDRFINGDDNMGTMMTGASGTGKSRMSDTLCNDMIDLGYPIIETDGIVPTLRTIEYFSNLGGVVLYFDEFAKHYPMKIQSKMLGMMTNSRAGKKLFILTENSSQIVSPFIANRPARIRYHFDFGKESPDVINEYCDDYGVSAAFRECLLMKACRSTIFSFDHLQALVSEHLFRPEESIDVLIETLNLHVLIKDPIVILVKLTKIEDGETITLDHSGLKGDLAYFTSPYLNTTVRGIDKDKKYNSVDIIHSMLTESSDDKLVFFDKGESYEATFRIERY